MKATDYGLPSNLCYKVIDIQKEESSLKGYDRWFYEDVLLYDGTQYRATMTHAEASKGKAQSGNGIEQGVCPKGYHIPSATEWTDLFYDLLQNYTTFYCGNNGGGSYTPYMENAYICWGLIFGSHFETLIKEYYWAAGTANVAVIPTDFPNPNPYTKWFKTNYTQPARVRCKAN